MKVYGLLSGSGGTDACEAFGDTWIDLANDWRKNTKKQGLEALGWYDTYLGFIGIYSSLEE